MDIVTARKGTHSVDVIGVTVVLGRLEALQVVPEAADSGPVGCCGTEISG